jgi:hypothetical protein
LRHTIPLSLFFLHCSGTHDGRISRTKQSATGELSPLETILYLGSDYTKANASHPCGSEESEDLCGRPLGMSFATTGELKGKLIVADCTQGIMAVDVDKKTKTTLVTQVDGLPIFFANSVVVGSRTGKLYFTDSSQRWRRTSFIYECMVSDLSCDWSRCRVASSDASKLTLA